MRVFSYRDKKYTIKTEYVLILNNQVLEYGRFTDIVKTITEAHTLQFEVYRWCTPCRKWMRVKIIPPKEIL